MRFICLANSLKEGGRCVAGIALNAAGNPVFENGRPKWIRPVSRTTQHGEVETSLVEKLQLLDIVEVNVVGEPTGTGYQSENVYFDEKHIGVAGKYSGSLDALCDKSWYIFTSHGKSIASDTIHSLRYSLMLFKIDQFAVVEKTYEDTHKKQLRMDFSYRGHRYDLPITDYDFRLKYQRNPDLIKACGSLYVTVSLGIELDGFVYKLISGIVY